MANEIKSTDRHTVFAERPPFPKIIMIEVTNACNHKCVFCVQNKMSRERRICDKEFTMRIIREAYENGAREIGMYINGEPFLCPHLDELIRYAKDVGYSYIYMDTNGAIATEEKLIRIIEAGIDSIKFSVNGATAESYRKVHGKDDFEAVKNTIFWLSEYIKKNNKDVSLFISFIKCNYNKDDIEQLHEYFDSVTDGVYVYDCKNLGRSMGDELIKSGVVDKLEGGVAPCSMIFNRIHVTVEGYFTACCVETEGKLVVADLHKTSLADAWNSDALVDLRRQHLTGKLKKNVCYNCIYNTSDDVLPLVEL